MSPPRAGMDNLCRDTSSCSHRKLAFGLPALQQTRYARQYGSRKCRLYCDGRAWRASRVSQLSPRSTYLSLAFSNHFLKWLTSLNSFYDSDDWGTPRKSRSGADLDSDDDFDIADLSREIVFDKDKAGSREGSIGGTGTNKGKHAKKAVRFSRPTAGSEQGGEFERAHSRICTHLT